MNFVKKGRIYFEERVLSQGQLQCVSMPHDISNNDIKIFIKRTANQGPISSYGRVLSSNTVYPEMFHD
jgi:hypothetical protein